MAYLIGIQTRLQATYTWLSHPTIFISSLAPIYNVNAQAFSHKVDSVSITTSTLTFALTLTIVYGSPPPRAHPIQQLLLTTLLATISPVTVLGNVMLLFQKRRPWKGLALCIVAELFWLLWIEKKPSMILRGAGMMGLGARFWNRTAELGLM